MPDLGRIGPYELRGELGRGAMARVWRAWDPNLEREVAIKEPLFDPSLSDEVLAEMGRRFVAEGRAAARLNHPNVVTIHAADVWDGRPAIVMELVEGATLSRLLEGGPLAPAEALSVMDQLLDALGYAHAHGVVHRDVKPDNVFVSPAGRVKLADFGIAHLDAGVTRATVAGAVLGTPGYMSPEQARGGDVDGRSDLFSAGVVAYEMLTGRNPFGAADATTLIYRIVHEPAPELPASATAGLPADLRPAIMAALSKDPNDRPPTAEAFRRMLHGQEGGTDESPKPPHPNNTRRWLPYAIVGGVLVVVICVVLFSAMSGGGGDGGVARVAQESTTAAEETSSAASTADESQAAETADATKAAQSSATQNTTYYVAPSNGYVAVFTNSSVQPYEVTDVAVADLSESSAAALVAHMGCSSIEEAATIVEALRSEAESNRVDRAAQQRQQEIEAAGPPAFTWTDASSELPPDKVTKYYGPLNAMDNEFTTAWNEGATGHGIGEWISFNADTPQWVHGVEIVGGYPKTSDIYYKNNRPREVTIQLSDGYETTVTLDDLYREYQRFDFGDYHQTTFIRVTIRSIYEGSTWDDTSICEMRAY